jgi:AcrR family transcriptional regulator
LLEAALAAFTESGLDAPSLDAICERAGCTRGAFYVHFADRDELIAAAISERRSKVLSQLLELPDGVVTTPRLLQLFAGAVASGAFPVPGAVRTGELLAACRRSKKIRHTQQRLMAETFARLHSRVESDQADGSVRRDVDAAALTTLLVLLEAGTELFHDLGVPLDIGAATRALAGLIAATPSR